MQIESLDYTNIYNFFHAFFFGLVDKPQNDSSKCDPCDYLGDAFGAIQEGLTAITVVKDMWWDFEEIKRLDFMEQVNRLLFVYLIFWSVGLNVDRVFQYSSLKQL